VTRPSHRIRFISLALAALTSIVVAASAQAAVGSGSLTSTLIGGDCGATQTVFAPWGDSHSYYFTSNGGFESGSLGWTLTGGAAVVSGNEPNNVHAASDDHSLLIPSGATATSPELCFGLLTPGIRFFATAPSGPATIHVQVIATGLLGGLSFLDGGTVTVGSGWAPTSVFSTLLSQLNVPVGTKSIQLRITSTGPVQIDDIYIDPFISH
jgi:hypothetical protein